MMDTSSQRILGDVTLGGNAVVLEYVTCESKEERLLNKGKESISKRKAQVLDTHSSSPRKSQHKFCQDTEVQKIMETNQCNELEDISTESDEVLGEDHRIRDLVHDTASSFLHAYDVDSLTLKENVVDGGESLTQERIESIGLGKSCLCSFCLKAAHMWMDLTFQDTRGRLTELQKSRKRATDQSAKFTQGFCRLSKSKKLEYDLMQTWKMIFVHTQDALDHQLAQTISHLQERSKLMENCKKELELRSSIFSG